jgi:hypothetical protein
VGRLSHARWPPQTTFQQQCGTSPLVRAASLAPLLAAIWLDRAAAERQPAASFFDHCQRCMNILTHAVFFAMILLAAIVGRWGHQREME